MATPATQCLGPFLHFLPHHQLTKVQEAVIPALYTSDANCLVAAPTGSGKTVLLEVAMLRLFHDILAPSLPLSTPMERPSLAGTPSSSTRRKAVYICPIKALANEKFSAWRAQFPTLTVAIETGDYQQTLQPMHNGTCEAQCTEAEGDLQRDASENMSSVSKADIIVTTPERWDSITRRWKEKEVMAIVNSVGLLLLDEVHTVQEERGAAMEAIVSRVKAIQASRSPPLTSLSEHSDGAPAVTPTRIIGISGTLPNYRDLAEWLQVPEEMTFSFTPSDRPVPLTIRVVGYANDSANPFAFQRFLSFKLFALIQEFSSEQPTLVFCASRKETTMSAQRLVDDIRDAAARQGQTALLQPSAEVEQLAHQASDKQLRSFLLMGVGFHHAAMTKEDRVLVECMFRQQYIAVICSTTTLALGVNLPAHLVIVKGTAFFGSGRCQDMPVSEVMQMCGRAGRPGLDKHGVALVLTMHRTAPIYETLSNGVAALTCVESQLHRNMIEHVNAEVALRTIHSFPSAIEWVRRTFFWIRLRKCPRHYGLEFATRAEETAFDAEAFVEALMERVLRVLLEEGCVRLSGAENISLQMSEKWPCREEESAVDIRQTCIVFEATRLGRAMSRMYILFDTVCTLNAEVRLHRVPPVEARTTAGEGCAVEETCDHAQLFRDTDETASTSDFITSEGNAIALEEDAEQRVGTPAATIFQKNSSIGSHRSTPFTLQETLRLLCHCQELIEVRLRQGDRGPLNELNKGVRFPLHSGRRQGREVREDWQKAYVLVQAHIGLLPVTEVSLRNDCLRLWSVMPRVSRFLEEYAWAATTSYTLSAHANVLKRSIERRVWPDGVVLRQLRHVNDAASKALFQGGYSSFRSFVNVDPRELEVRCNRLPPFGSHVLEEVRQLPNVQATLRFLDGDADGSGLCHRGALRSCEVTLTLRSFLEGDGNMEHAESHRNAVGTTLDQADTTFGGAKRVLLLVGHQATDAVLLKRYIPLSSFRVSDGAAHPSSLSGFTESQCLRVSFRFSLPLDAVRSRKGDALAEARCLVQNFVGIDTLAVLNDVDTCTEHITCDGGAYDSGENAGTLNSFLLPERLQGQKENLDGSTCTSTTPNAQVAQTVMSLQIAEEARTSFNDLMADLTYISTSECPTRRKRSSVSPGWKQSLKYMRFEVPERQEAAGQCEMESSAAAGIDVKEACKVVESVVLPENSQTFSIAKGSRHGGRCSAERSVKAATRRDNDGYGSREDIEGAAETGGGGGMSALSNLHRDELSSPQISLQPCRSPTSVSDHRARSTSAGIAVAAAFPGHSPPLDETGGRLNPVGRTSGSAATKVFPSPKRGAFDVRLRRCLSPPAIKPLPVDSSTAVRHPFSERPNSASIPTRPDTKATAERPCSLTTTATSLLPYRDWGDTDPRMEHGREGPRWLPQHNPPHSVPTPFLSHQAAAAHAPLIPPNQYSSCFDSWLYGSEPPLSTWSCNPAILTPCRSRPERPEEEWRYRAAQQASWTCRPDSEQINTMESQRIGCSFYYGFQPTSGDILGRLHPWNTRENGTVRQCYAVQQIPPPIPSRFSAPLPGKPWPNATSSSPSSLYQDSSRGFFQCAPRFTPAAPSPVTWVAARSPLEAPEPAVRSGGPSPWYWRACEGPTQPSTSGEYVVYPQNGNAHRTRDGMMPPRYGHTPQVRRSPLVQQSWWH